MTSRLPQTGANVHVNQENLTSRLLGKSAVINSKAQPAKKALGDLGNRIHNLQNVQNTQKNNVLGPPVAMAKKKVEVTKKIVSAATKEMNLKNNKENVARVNGRKPIRQESIILPKPTLQLDKKVDETTSMSITEQTKDLIIYDPDENTRDDPQMVTEYIQDILAYVKSIEDEFPIKEKYLENAKVTPKMRATLINWLVDAHQNFAMGLESLHLCISIIDRYLQVNKAVDRSVFQLVGTSALLLAAKYEEVYIPDLEDFVFICDDAFTKKQVLQMEIDIFKRLDFRMGWPISIYFLRRYSKIASVRLDQHTLAKYILELALIDYSVVHIKPSTQAAAACCLSMAIINEIMDPIKVWTPTLAHYTKHKYSDFKPVVYEFAHMLVRAETSKFDSIRRKYSTSKHGKISLNFKLQGPLIRKLTLSPTLKRN